jgi:hypothetical protein
MSFPYLYIALSLSMSEANQVLTKGMSNRVEACWRILHTHPRSSSGSDGLENIAIVAWLLEVNLALALSIFALAHGPAFHVELEPFFELL